MLAIICMLCALIVALAFVEAALHLVGYDE